MKRVTLAVLICGLLTTFVAGAVCAGSDTQWKDITSSTITAAFNKYAGPEPLLSVVLYLEGTISGTVRIENKADVPQDITVTFSGLLTLQKGVNGLLTCNPLFSKVYTCDYYDGAGDWAKTPGAPNGSTGSGYSEDVTKNDSKTLTYSAGVDDLSGYIGAGTVDFAVLRKGNTTVAFDNDVDNWCSAVFTGRASLTYNYSDTPEPGSMAAMLAGLTGLIGIGIRRRVK